jgi:hypothetical protein
MNFYLIRNRKAPWGDYGKQTLERYDLKGLDFLKGKKKKKFNCIVKTIPYSGYENLFF